MKAFLSEIQEVPFHQQPGVPILAQNMHAYEAMCEGYHRTFKMYIPEACRQGRGSFPLIVVNHGGESHNIYTYTVWHLLAEREKLIILYPECWYENTPWNIWALMNDVGEYPDDVAYIDAVIDYAIGKYAIDETQIHMTGHSMGDGITTYYAVAHPKRLASAAGTQGPSKSMWMMNSDGTLRMEPQGPIPFVRTHGEEDCFFAKALTDEERKWFKQQCHITPNNRLWLIANHCENVPRIRTDWEKNELIYKGEAESRFIAYVRGMHRPPISYVEDLWESLFSRCRRIDGRIVVEEGADEPDQKAIAVCAGSADSFYDNSVSKAGSNVMPCQCRDGRLYVDCTLFKSWFQGTEVKWQDEKKAVRLLSPQVNAIIYLSNTMKKGASDRRLIEAGSRECPATMQPGGSISVIEINGRLDAIPGILIEDGHIMMPFSAVMEKVFHRYTYEAYNVGYAVDHAFRLAYDLCFTIKRILGTEKDMTSKELYDTEQKIYQMEREDLGMELPNTEKELVLQWIHV